MLFNLLKYFSLIPVIVSGIEHIHGGVKNGALKKELAMQALGLAYGTASAVIPGQQAEIDAATGLASSVIDATVSAFNKAGWTLPAKK